MLTENDGVFWDELHEGDEDYLNAITFDNLLRELNDGMGLPNWVQYAGDLGLERAPSHNLRFALIKPPTRFLMNGPEWPEEEVRTICLKSIATLNDLDEEAVFEWFDGGMKDDVFCSMLKEFKDV